VLKPSWLKALVCVAIAALLAFGATACGSDDDDSSASETTTTTAGNDVVAEAQTTVDAALKPATDWPGPNDPVTPPSGAKKVTVIYCGATGVACKVSADGVVEAGKTLGWDVQAIDGQQQPTVQNQALQNAVAQGVDGVIIDAVVPALVAGGLDAAKKAGRRDPQQTRRRRERRLPDRLRPLPRG
jgi:ribose transport system substrate-binding protein